VAAHELSVRLLSYYRPGGRSRRRDRRIADAITDIRGMVRALGMQRMGIWGFSGGGCYVLACAAMLPELVIGAAVFAPFASCGSPGLAFCEGM
jgi:hypothetical protein